MNEEIIRRVLLNPKLADVLRADYGRLSAQVISGVGFLGAGTIIHNKGSIKGLTTAATLWLVACLGIAVGYGYYFISLTATVGCVIILIFLKRFQTRIFHSSEHFKFEVEFAKRSKAVDFIDEYFDAKNIHVITMEFIVHEESERKACIYTVSIPKSLSPVNIIKELVYNENIYEIRELIEEH